MGRCHYCGTDDEELRPYGPGGDDVCFGCANATPEREADAGRAFGALLEAAEAASPVGVAAIGLPTGPQAYIPRGA
jgi:hypothetical protein